MSSHKGLNRALNSTNSIPYTKFAGVNLTRTISMLLNHTCQVSFQIVMWSRNYMNPMTGKWIHDKASDLTVQVFPSTKSPHSTVAGIPGRLVTCVYDYKTHEKEHAFTIHRLILIEMWRTNIFISLSNMLQTHALRSSSCASLEALNQATVKQRKD